MLPARPDSTGSQPSRGTMLNAAHVTHPSCTCMPSAAWGLGPKGGAAPTQGQCQPRAAFDADARACRWVTSVAQWCTRGRLVILVHACRLDGASGGGAYPPSYRRLFAGRADGNLPGHAERAPAVRSPRHGKVCVQNWRAPRWLPSSPADDGWLLLVDGQRGSLQE